MLSRLASNIRSFCLGFPSNEIIDTHRHAHLVHLFLRFVLLLVVCMCVSLHVRLLDLEVQGPTLALRTDCWSSAKTVKSLNLSSPESVFPFRQIQESEPP